MHRVLDDRTAVIVDRHPMWVHALEQLVSRIGIEVLASSADPDALVPLVSEHRPDVLVTDADAASCERVVADLRGAFASHPELKAVIVGNHADAETIDALFAEGASAFCTKDAAPGDLAAAISQSFERSVFLNDLVGGRSPRSRGAATGDLTKREAEILTMVADGYSNAQVAQRLFVTEQTVKFHLSNVYRKLDVTNRTEASRWAQLHGLLPGAEPAPKGLRLASNAPA